MKKVIAILVAAFLAISTLTSLSYARGRAETLGKGEIINDTCPVMGGKIDEDTPYKTEYKGKIIGFCCPDCVGKFKDNPEKYMAKLKKGYMIECPKCGAEIDVTEYCKKAYKGRVCPMGREYKRR